MNKIFSIKNLPLFLPQREGWSSSFWLPILSGVILSFSFPRIDFWPLAWFALVPLFIFIQSVPRRRQAFLGGFLFSIVFFGISTNWMCYVTVSAWVVGLIFESLFYACMCLLAKELFLRHHCKVCFWSNLQLFLALPALWVVVEWVRGEFPIIAFGWNLLVHSQSDNLNLLQNAQLIGGYGVSFLVALGNSFIFMLWRLLSSSGSALHRFLIVGFISLFTAGMLFGAFSYGEAQLNKRIEGRIVRASLIQGNIPQESKWDPRIKKAIIEKYIKLSELADFDGPDLIVWPEAAYPGYLNIEQNDEFLSQIAAIGVPFLVGALTQESETVYYNSAYFISSLGKIVNRYDKILLVPFGEYLPFKTALFFLESLASKLGVSDFSSGDEIKLFSVPLSNTSQLDSSDNNSFLLGTLICFENIFPGLSRRLALAGAQVLCVITNDAWFQKSAAPFQHLQSSILRAVETGRWVFHVANTGVTAFISPKGEVVDSIKDKAGREIFVMGGITRAIPLAVKDTFYLKVGFLFPCLAFFLLLQALLPFRKQDN